MEETVLNHKKISIIMLTYNASKYVRQSVESLAEKTVGVDYELIVVDNHSRLYTRHLLNRLKKQDKIHKLLFNKKNLLFAGGNNAGTRLCDAKSTHYLLLNSDILIYNKDWLKKLLEICPTGGISAYGLVENKPVRADGYCMLVAKETYDKYKLDEHYQWFWSITKLEAMVLRDGKRIVAVKNHEAMLHHFGGKSGNAYRGAQGMNEDMNVIYNWFDQCNHIEIIDKISEA
jgi:glycosyltransferase involved in cell wall biosynthesis